MSTLSPAEFATKWIGSTRTERAASQEHFIDAFMGDTKGGPFDIDEETAREMLTASNPDGRSNADVVRPWVNGLDIARRSRHMWIIDFGIDTAEEEAALYEAPFEYVKQQVRPARAKSRTTIEEWWVHERRRGEMREALVGLERFIGTARVSKYRLFVWLPIDILPDSQVIVFARDDDYFFGVLHSGPHRLWGLRQGTQLETRPRYTPTTTFETFPFPTPTPEQEEAIAAACSPLPRSSARPPTPGDSPLPRRSPGSTVRRRYPSGHPTPIDSDSTVAAIDGSIQRCT